MPFPTFAPPSEMQLRPRLAPSFLRPWIPRLCRTIATPYLRMVGYQSLTLRGQDEAARLWTEFYAGKIRLVVAFRHPYGNDPQVLTAAVVKGLRLGSKRLPFLQFVHGSEVGWWAGALARWAIPRVGGLPVDHGRMGPSQVNAIRKAILEGAHPLGLAPEGQVTYSAYEVQRVEAGISRLSFLAAEELEARGQGTRLVVLPVSLYQNYPEGTDKRLRKVVADLEEFCFGKQHTGEPWERLNGLREGIFLLTEAWYRQNHGHRAPEGPWTKDRLLPLLERALTVGERILGLDSDGDFFARLYRIRSTGWERLYPPSEGWETRPELEKRLAYRSQTEAWSAFRHMELADLAWYLGTGEPEAGSATGYLADYAENLYDLLVRVSGGNISHRKALFPRGVEVVFGEGLDLTARLGDYKARKKETLAQTMADLIDAWRKSAPEENRV